MGDNKTLVDTIKTLRDANISKEAGSEHNEEVVGGVPTKLHNTETSNQAPDEDYTEEQIAGMKQAFQELRDEESSGRPHYV